jgi:plastocyanin
MRVAFAALAIIALACGGSNRADTGETEATAETTARRVPAQRVTTGALHEVRMLGTSDGRFLYEPASLTIKVGDRVRWINVSGGPHNVAFYADRIPAGASAFLQAAMTRRIGDLAGELLFQANAVYEIGFAGAPPGTYVYFCTPHEMLGMTGQLTILP